MKQREMERARKDGWGWWSAVLALTALKLAAHLFALDVTLPIYHEPDTALVKQSLLHRGEASHDQHAWAKYPHLVGRAMALVPRAAELPEHDVEEELATHLEFAGRELLAGRLAVALLSALVVPVTWLLARRFLAPGPALVATLFVVTSVMALNFGRQARPHAPLAVTATAALVAACALARRGSLARYLVAGVTAGLAVGTLQSGVFVLLSGLAAHAFAARGGGLRGQAKLALPVALVALAVAAFYPWLWDGSSAGEGEHFAGSDEFPHRVYDFDGSGFALLWGHLWDYDPVMSALALLAVALGVLWIALGWRVAPAGRGIELLVVLAGALPYLLVLGLYARVFARFLNPLVPLLAILAAVAVEALARLLGRVGRLGTARARVLVATLALALPAYTCARLLVVQARADTWTLAARWIESVVVEGERVLVSPNLSLPLFQSIPRGPGHRPEETVLKHRWFKYQASLAPGALRSRPAPLVVLAKDGRMPVEPKDYPRRPAQVRAALEQLHGDWAVVAGGGAIFDVARDVVADYGELATVFSPWTGRTGDELGMEFQSAGFWRDVLDARCMGPVIEVYRLSTR